MSSPVPCMRRLVRKEKELAASEKALAKAEEDVGDLTKQLSQSDADRKKLQAELRVTIIIFQDFLTPARRGSLVQSDYTLKFTHIHPLANLRGTSP